jgi:hypothetical protein
MHIPDGMLGDGVCAVSDGLAGLGASAAAAILAAALLSPPAMFSTPVAGLLGAACTFLIAFLPGRKPATRLRNA